MQIEQGKQFVKMIANCFSKIEQAIPLTKTTISNVDIVATERGKLFFSHQDNIPLDTGK